VRSVAIGVPENKKITTRKKASGDEVFRLRIGDDEFLIGGNVVAVGVTGEVPATLVFTVDRSTLTL